MRCPLVSVIFLAVVVSGCADSSTPGKVDAGGDAALDSGFDSSVDADSGAVVDMGLDAAPLDASTDAGFDAGHDAGLDAGRDAGTDAGSDAGTDAGVDAGPTCTCSGASCCDGCHPLTDGTPCNDYMAGTVDDRCSSGTCAGREPECLAGECCDNGLLRPIGEVCKVYTSMACINTMGGTLTSTTYRCTGVTDSSLGAWCQVTPPGPTVTMEIVSCPGGCYASTCYP